VKVCGLRGYKTHTFSGVSDCILHWQSADVRGASKMVVAIKRNMSETPFSNGTAIGH
jgi:hypothetical protein